MQAPSLWWRAQTPPLLVRLVGRESTQMCREQTQHPPASHAQREQLLRRMGRPQWHIAWTAWQASILCRGLPHAAGVVPVVGPMSPGWRVRPCVNHAQWAPTATRRIWTVCRCASTVLQAPSTTKLPLPASSHAKSVLLDSTQTFLVSPGARFAGQVLPRAHEWLAWQK
jgi:hypothetical protein